MSTVHVFSQGVLVATFEGDEAGGGVVRAATSVFPLLSVHHHPIGDGIRFQGDGAETVGQF